MAAGSGLLKVRIGGARKGISRMRLSHTRPVVAARFDEPNLVSAAGLVPVMRLAADAGLDKLAAARLTVPTDKGSNPGGKVSALVAGMVAGADCIDDLALLRHGAMGRVFDRPYAPSTLGSFLRAFTFGHVRQLDAVASRFLAGLAARTPVLAGLNGPDGPDGTAGRVLVDVDDSVVQVHGHAKQGAGFGYCGVRGLNMLLATVSTAQAAPVIVAQRLRKGSAASARGAGQLVTDALATVRALQADATGTTTAHSRGAGAAAGGRGLLRVPDRARGAARRRRGVGHRADGPQGQGRHRRHR